MSLFQKAQNNIDTFWDVEIERNPVYAPKISDVLELIDLYWSSKYKESNWTQVGQSRVKKVFFNIVENPVFVAGMLTDLDLKNIRVVPTIQGAEFASFLLQKDLFLYLREKKFSQLLNQIKYLRPKYGTVVLKKFKEGSEVKIAPAPIQNLRYPADAKSIEKAWFFAEIHRLWPEELKAKKEVWDGEVIDKVLEKNKEDKIEIIEYFGELDSSSNNYFILADGDFPPLAKGKREIKDTYKALDWDERDDRFLGEGLVEKNFEAQIHLNRIALFKANALHWTSKHIYQTRDHEINRNLLYDVADGDIIKQRSEITPIATEERNLAAYAQEESRWEFNLQRRMFAQEPLRRPVSGVTLGAVAIATQLQTGFYEDKREEMGLFVKDVIWDWVIPEFKKRVRDEHLIAFTSEDPETMRKVDDLIIKQRVSERIKDYIARNGSFPLADQVRLMRITEQERLRDPNKRFIKVPAGFYDNLKFKLDIVITGESTDVQAKLNAIMIGLQTTQDPNERRQLMSRLFALLGEEPIDTSQTESIEDVLADRLRQGSPPRINLGNLPARGRQQATL